MANFFEIKIPVRKNEGWNDWAKNMRSTIKSAGIPVRWQMFHYHMTLLFLDDDNCVENLNQEFEQCISVFYSLPKNNLCSIAFSMRLNTAIIGVIRLKRGH